MADPVDAAIDSWFARLEREARAIVGPKLDTMWANEEQLWLRGEPRGGEAPTGLFSTSEEVL